MSQTKTTPVFENEMEESVFWESSDSSKYVDWDKAKKVELSNLKPSSGTIPRSQTGSN